MFLQAWIFAISQKKKKKRKRTHVCIIRCTIILRQAIYQFKLSTTFRRHWCSQTQVVKDAYPSNFTSEIRSQRHRLNQRHPNFSKLSNSSISNSYVNIYVRTSTTAFKKLLKVSNPFTRVRPIPMNLSPEFPYFSSSFTPSTNGVGLRIDSKILAIGFEIGFSKRLCAVSFSSLTVSRELGRMFVTGGYWVVPKDIGS